MKLPSPVFYPYVDGVTGMTSPKHPRVLWWAARAADEKLWWKRLFG